jgi:hypothetical protein
MSHRSVALSFLVCVVVNVCACAGEETQFSTRVAVDMPRDLPLPISVFGVFRDGRMNTRTWDDFSPRLDALGLEPCAAIYDVDFVANDGALAAAIDDYTRRNGVSDSLLAAVGDAAKADLILTFVVSGSVSTRRPPPEGRPRVAPSGMYRPPRGAYAPQPGPHREPVGLEINAALFSKSRHAVVAAVVLHYNGRSENDAIAMINAKLKDLFPTATCEGWDTVAHPIDADGVRRLPEE